uniref:UBX domain-containing protein 11 n=1 Tax=Stegastes partitus TaxID=144197 RepID=A0A3B5A9R6_9TELE
MFDGPFRSYQEYSTQQCMQDLMDGYFPSELQERFPDGVPFEVSLIFLSQTLYEEFVSRLPWEAFPGEGQAVCGRKAEPAGKKMTTDQFLNKLPKLVVKAGRVIDIRDPLRAILQVSRDTYQQPSVFTETPVLQVVINARFLLHQGSSPDAQSSSLILIDTPNQDSTPLVYCLLSLHHVTRAARLHHRGAGLPGYDIISVHPQRCYDDDGQTLRSCGLTTNANLLLRKKRHSGAVIEVNKAVEG